MSIKRARERDESLDPFVAADDEAIEFESREESEEEFEFDEDDDCEVDNKEKGMDEEEICEDEDQENGSATYESDTSEDSGELEREPYALRSNKQTKKRKRLHLNSNAYNQSKVSSTKSNTTDESIEHTESSEESLLKNCRKGKPAQPVQNRKLR